MFRSSFICASVFGVVVGFGLANHVINGPQVLSTRAIEPKITLNVRPMMFAEPAPKKVVASEREAVKAKVETVARKKKRVRVRAKPEQWSQEESSMAALVRSGLRGN